jgi:hypothetical protein
MNNEFEYVTYTEEEWPATPENDDVEADYDYDDWVAGSGWAESADRTEALITQGRTSAPQGKLKARRAAASARLASGRLGSGLPTGTVPAGGGPGGSGASAPPRTGRPGTAGPLGRSRPVVAGRTRRKLSRRNLIIAGVTALALGVALGVALSGPDASWPDSVAIVKQDIQVACVNPNVASDPGQVNFACAKDTSQVLWVFALMTSGDNPNFSDPPTGRKGLEPISPVQGGEVAWSLNLHHPYNPASPTDSLAVAARAINNIIGGATVTGQNGKQVVQPGLEGNSANCRRYTGSAALISRQGFPALCAKPITTPQGEAALVADVYQRWMSGAPKQDAGNAAILFSNANNPGDPRVQAILRSLGLIGQ